MSTNAFATFEAAFADASQLIEIYDAAQISPEKKEVLKRAAVILAVTAWETYLEEVLQEKFDPLLAAAEKPADLQSAFDQVARRWLKNPALTPADLSSWTGDNWKKEVKAFFTNQIKALNTPNSKNARKLFKDFLNIDLGGVWKWHGHNFESACIRLDDIVSKRGSFTHEAKRRSGPRPGKDPLTRQQVASCLKFFKDIAAATDVKV